MFHMLYVKIYITKLNNLMQRMVLRRRLVILLTLIFRHTRTIERVGMMNRLYNMPFFQN